MSTIIYNEEGRRMNPGGKYGSSIEEWFGIHKGLHLEDLRAAYAEQRVWDELDPATAQRLQDVQEESRRLKSTLESLRKDIDREKQGI